MKDGALWCRSAEMKILTSNGVQLDAPRILPVHASRAPEVCRFFERMCLLAGHRTRFATNDFCANGRSLIAKAADEFQPLSPTLMTLVWVAHTDPFLVTLQDIAH